MSTEYDTLISQIAQITHRGDLAGQMPFFVEAANELITVRLSLVLETPTDSNDANAILVEYPNLYLYASLISAYEFINELDMATHYVDRFNNEVSRYYITATGRTPSPVMGGDYVATGSPVPPVVPTPTPDPNASAVFNTVAEMIAAGGFELNELVQCLDYAAGNNAGLLSFRSVAVGTGTQDGGSYIDGIGVQWQQLFTNGNTNVKQWGAVGDGVTDDTIAINNCIAYCFGSVGVNLQYTNSVVFPPSEYAVSSVNLTDYIAGPNAGRNLVVWAQGATLVGNTAGVAVLDATASRWLWFHGLTVNTADGVEPKHGIQVGNKGTEACGNNKFFGVQCLGTYSLGSFGNYGSETTQYYSCRFVNRSQGAEAYAYYGDGQTLKVPTSQYVTITRVQNTPVSFTQNAFYGCQFRQVSGTCGPVFLSRSAGWVFDQGCYNLSYDFAGYLLHSTSASRNVGLTIGGLCETQQTTPPDGPGTGGVQELIRFTGDGTNSSCVQLSVQVRNASAQAYLFAADNVGSMALTMADLSFTTPLNALSSVVFGPHAAGWLVSGNICVEDATRLNLAEVTFNGVMQVDSYDAIESLPSSGAYTIYDEQGEVYSTGSKGEAYTPWVVYAVAVGVLTVNQKLVTVSEGAPTSITDIVATAPATGLREIIIRNASNNAITLVNDTAKIRNNSGADLVLNSNQTAHYIEIVTGIWQQVGGKQ